MAQFTPPARANHLLSITQCLRLEGKAKLALGTLDFRVRQSVISVKSGLTSEQRSEVGSALTAVLMTIATDMAFVAYGNTHKDGLRDRLHVLLDECFDWSDKKHSMTWKREDSQATQKSNNDNDNDT